MSHKVICQYWQVQCLDTKYTAIPGIKTLHLTLDCRKQMLDSIQETNARAKAKKTGLVLRPYGQYKEITVDNSTFQKLKKSDRGLEIALAQQIKKRTD